MVGNINAVGAAGSKNFGEFGSDATKAAARMGQLADAIKSGNYEIGILGQQDLQPLLQALEAAKQRAEAAAQAAEQAKQKFNDLAQSIHDELLQQQGDEKALEDERHQKRLDDLKAEAQAANELDSQAYRQAVSDENALHALKDKNIADNAAKQKQSSQSQGGGSGNGFSQTNGAGAGQQQSNNGGGGAGGLNLNHTINVNVPNAGALKGLTDADINSLMEQIGPQLLGAVMQQLRFASSRA